MVVDNVVIRIQADINNMKAGMQTLTGDVKKLEQGISSLTGTSAKLDAGLKAFSWTTFAGGALNVTTALAQLYTSISNLDRVQLQVKNSMVGIERAEDLLAKKTMMLNKEISKNGILTQRSQQLRNEIATATDDLANKEEKLKLAQDQVNDTYILFTTNIAGTLFGTIQTLVGLKSMLAIKSLAAATASGVLATANIADAASTEVSTAAKVKNLTATSLLTAAITAQSVATGANTGANVINSGSMLGSVASGGRLNNMLSSIFTTAGATRIGMIALGAALFSTGKSMDEMDGVADNLYTRFHNVTIQTDLFGKSIDSLVDRGDAMTVFGHKLAEALSLGTYKAPNLEKFQKQSAKQLLDELGPVFSLGLTADSSIEDFQKAFAQKLDDVTVILKNKRQKLIDETLDQKGIEGLVSINVTPEEIKTITGYYDEVENRSKALYDLSVQRGEAEFDIVSAVELTAEALQKEYNLSHSITENIKKSTLESMKFNNIRASGNRHEEDSLITQNKLMDNLKKNEIDFKYGLDLAKRFHIDSKSNRGIVLNITGVDLGEISNTLALPDAIKKANMHIFSKQFDNRTGGKTQGVLDYLNKQASDFIKMSKANDLGAMTNGFIGSKVNFGKEFFKSTGATAAYQVPKGSVRASADFYSNIKKIDEWNNSVRGQEIKVAASLITGEPAWFSGGNEKRARKLSKAETDTLSLAGALGFRPSNIDKVDGIINTTVDSMISESNAFLDSMTGSIPRSMISGVFGAAGSLITNIQESFGSKLYGAGSSGRYSLQRDVNKLKNASASSLFNNVVSRFNGGNYGEYDATVMSTLLGATFAHPELSQEYSSFQNKIAPILGITHNEFTSVLSESTRGYSEIDDRMRYKGRLEQISTGATVF